MNTIQTHVSAPEEDWDVALDAFDGITVEGGVDTDKEEDNCTGGACKI